MLEIIGTEFNELFTGTDEDDVIIGLSGSDTMDGGEGHDVLFRGKGDVFSCPAEVMDMTGLQTLKKKTMWST